MKLDRLSWEKIEAWYREAGCKNAADTILARLEATSTKNVEVAFQVDFATSRVMAPPAKKKKKG